MKKFVKICVSIIALCASLFSVDASAQKNSYYFYGVDFTHLKVYGAYEVESDFVRAFKGINGLFIYEAKKYNISKALNHKYAICADTMIEYNAQADFSALKSDNPNIEELDIAALVKEYDLPHDSGTGAIFIARLFDKTHELAVFDIAVFDIESRNMIMLISAEGEPGGMGLRNYWAGAIYDILDNMNISVD